MNSETALEKWEREAEARGFVEPPKTPGASTREMLIFLTTAISKESTESKLRQRFGDIAFDEAYSQGFITRTPQPSPSKRVTSITLKGREWIGDQETEKEEEGVKPGTRYNITQGMIDSISTNPKNREVAKIVAQRALDKAMTFEEFKEGELLFAEALRDPKVWEGYEYLL